MGRMSVYATVWAFQQHEISSTEKFVLVCLADYANQDNECFPSQARLAEMTELSERGVRAALAGLEAKGLILRTPRRERGLPTSDWYKLAAPLPEFPKGRPGSNGAVVPFAIAKAVYERDGYRCRRCGCGSNLSIDHVLPRALGGSNEESNLQVLCRSCNTQKGASAPGFNRMGLPERRAGTTGTTCRLLPEPAAGDPKERDPSVDPKISLSSELESPSSQERDSATWEDETSLWLRDFLLTEQHTFEKDRIAGLINSEWWVDLSDAINGVTLDFLRVEFAKMALWLSDNPKRAPLKRGVRRFVWHWLERAAERRRKEAGNASQAWRR